MMSLSPILMRAVAVAAALAALALAYHLWAGHQQDIGRAEVRAEWQADRLNIAEQNRLLLMANARKTDELQAKADKQRGIANAENHALSIRVSELAGRLRDRPNRPDAGSGGVATATGTGAAGSGNASCTGAGLYKPDGEFLAGLAASADRLRIALKSCRAGRQADIETVNGIGP